MDRTELETANIPEERGTYKFVQVYLNGIPYMRFGKALMLDQHGEILSDFLESAGVEYRTVKMPGGSAPDEEGPEYSLSGAGTSFVFPGRRIKLLSSSATYGLGPDPEHLAAVAEEYPDYDFEISSED